MRLNRKHTWSPNANDVIKKTSSCIKTDPLPQRSAVSNYAVSIRARGPDPDGISTAPCGHCAAGNKVKDLKAANLVQLLIRSVPLDYRGYS